MLTSLIALSTVATAATAAPLQAKGERYAFIVGIDRYDDDAIPRLDGAVKDARALKEALIAKCGFDPRRITMMTTDSLDPILKPTKTNLSRVSAAFLSQDFQPDDVVFMFYAGHAVEIGGGAYLVPMDATLTPNRIIGDAAELFGMKNDKKKKSEEDTPAKKNEFKFSPEQMNLLNAAIPFRIGQLPVKHVLAAFDMCRTSAWDSVESEGKMRSVFTTAIQNSTDVTRAVAIGEGPRDNNVQTSSAVWFACQPGKASFETNGRGYFSLALERGITTNEADGNKDGEVSVVELKSYLDDAVPKLSGGKQAPMGRMEGFGIENYRVARVGTTATGPKPRDTDPVTKPTETPTTSATEGTNTSGTTTPQDRGTGVSQSVQDVFKPNVYQFLPGKQWCDIVSGEGGFTIRMPVQLQESRPPKRLVREVEAKGKKGEDPKKANMITYYYDNQTSYLYYRFGASFVNFPGEYKDEKQVLAWGETLLRDKANGDVFSKFMENFLKDLFTAAFNIPGVTKKSSQVYKADFKVGKFPGKRMLALKKDGSFVVIQFAAIKNRLFIFQELYDGGDQTAPFQKGYFIGSLNFFPELLETPDKVLPIFDTEPIDVGG